MRRTAGAIKFCGGNDDRLFAEQRGVSRRSGGAAGERGVCAPAVKGAPRGEHGHHEVMFAVPALIQPLAVDGQRHAAALQSFLQAGVIDELSLLLAPVTDGSRGSASLFTQLSSLNEGSPVEFTLKTVEKAGDNGVYLNYLAENAENGQ